MIVLNYIGILMVSVFYFVSGYGLSYGIEHKKNYLNTFLKKRLLNILIPYWILLLIKIVIKAFFGKFYTISQILLSFIGFEFVTNTWFVISIILMYIMFFVAFSIKKKFILGFYHAFYILIIEVVCYTVICLALKLPTCYTASVFCFCFGILYEKNEKNIINSVNKKYFISLLLFIFISIITFGGRLVISYYGVNNEILHTVLRNIACLSFVIMVTIIMIRIEFNGIVCFLGEISYELYISHTIILDLLVYRDKKIGYSTIVIISAIVLSVITHIISKNIRNKVIRS